MPLSIFIDALPYNEMKENYTDWLSNTQLAELIPNIAYSSSLHWQLYCNKYPDERGVLVDWTKVPEKKKAVKLASALFRPLDSLGNMGIVSKKFLDRCVFRRNTFANIPYKFRKHFSARGKYLFWNKETYHNEDLFKDYCVVSQDEGHKSFDATIEELTQLVASGEKKIFAVFGFADSLGHKCRRGEIYSQRLRPYMDTLRAVILEYQSNHPNEPVLIVSDHGMSTVTNHVDLALEQKFGKQSKKTYIAYKDSAIMLIWTENESLKKSIAAYLSDHPEGHLLTEEDRARYKVTDLRFGDLIYILKEGNVFSNNWFGKSLKKPGPDGSGMHGFWPEWEAKDQMACILLSSKKRGLAERYDYPSAQKLINDIMTGDTE